MSEFWGAEARKRLVAALKRVGTQEDVCRATGIPVPTIQKILSNNENINSDPAISRLLKLVGAADVTLHYVLTGETLQEGDYGITTNDAAANQRRLPVYDVYASAGGGAQVFEDKPTGFLHFPSKYADSLGSADSLEIVRVTGDSMEPSFKAGDQVMIDTSASLRDGVYVIRLDDQILLKRIQLLEPGKLRLISDNHIYPPQEIMYGDLPSVHFEIKGRAVWTGRAL